MYVLLFPFLYIVCQPPISFLFPYTTLFRSILVVDDEKSQRDILSMILGSEGYEVFTASSGSQALKQSQKEHYDLVLTDLIDRKSTRLNSSHRCISYAVFCLKKKTNIKV